MRLPTTHACHGDTLDDAPLEYCIQDQWWRSCQCRCRHGYTALYIVTAAQRLKTYRQRKYIAIAQDDQRPEEIVPVMQEGKDAD